MSKHISNQLADLLVGKTIKAITSPGVSECICQFTLADGSQFRLHATDLGAWIEKAIGIDGLADSLDALIGDYSHHAYHIQTEFDYDPHVFLKDEILTISAVDGKEFKGKVSSFSPEDRMIVNHKKGIKLISKAAPLGSAWRSMLNHKYYPDICPEELSQI